MNLQQEVAALLARLDGPRAEEAVCDLTCLTEALPFVAEVYYREPDARRRELLIYCLWQYRDVAALPTLEAALRDPDERVWKEALDGLVALGGDGANRVLHEARAALSEDVTARTRCEWIDEAIDQVRETTDPG